jgi:hypothetical protein
MSGVRKTEKQQSYNYENENVVMRQPLRAQSLDTEMVGGTRVAGTVTARRWRRPSRLEALLRT